MSVLSCITTEHNLWLVLLAGVVCIAGCWVAFDLIKRAGERNAIQKAGWTFLSAVAFGSAAWCTHFIAMLAYDVKAPVTYDPLLTLGSFFVAVAGAAIGIHLALRKEISAFPLIGGAVIGLAVTLMHYMGMSAYHVDGLVEWNLGYVAASAVFSLVLSGLALHVFARGRFEHAQYAALALLVGSILLLHFTGMTAITVTPFVTGANVVESRELHTMAVAIAAVGLLVVATGVISRLIDTSANWETVQRLQKLAHFDILTGLPNRANFIATLAEYLDRAKSTHHFVAVAALDLDNFKEINDLRGHEAGDLALKAIAERFTGALGRDEFVARIGGDEFMAIKLFRHQSALDDFINRIKATVFTPMHVDDLETVLGASIGVSIYPADTSEPERLVSNADLAMYRAKSDASRAVCFYEPDMDQRQRDRRILALSLRQAVERGELELHYQVQTVVATSKVCGYEVLLRWNHPQRGRVPPTEFIPIAEETGSIGVIGDWVLRTACAEAATWETPHKIAVNISAIQLNYTDLAQKVTEILRETGLPPERLELEITETAIIVNKERTLNQLRRVQALGVTIAIDDFGTGYSSLDTLRSFPFDKIKLDRSFMREIEHSAQSLAIFRAVMALGRSLDISVLAEGVETLDQFAILKRESCDEAQGYLLGRPGPWVGDAEEVASALQSAAA
jgi:diguanylate cyclase (GGDEF)-like protein